MLLAVPAIFACADAARAQIARRTVESGAPEAQLMGYYAAVMQFTPVGLPAKAGRIEIGGAATYIPAIPDEDRLAGFGGTKYENTNICKFYPRLTASFGRGRMAIEAGFTPPVEVCGVKASVISLAIGRRMALGQEWEGFARLSGFTGYADVSVTCGPEAVVTALDQTCYGGSLSSDRIAPLGLAFEYAAAYQGWRRSRIEPYLAAGIRYERVNFDVNYTRTVAQGAAVGLPALDDHSRYRSNLARVHVAAGAAWDPIRNLRFGTELYYAPGAVMTLRGRVAVAL